jgi:hypothetical protein
MKATTTVLLAQLLAGAAALLLSTSCKKDKKDDTLPPQEQVLKVNFASTSVINYNLVDSGYVVFTKEGSNTQYFKRFEKKTSAWTVVTSDLPAGNWTAEMYLFTRHDDKAGRRYRQEKTFTRTVKADDAPIQVDGPTGKIADAWKPSAFFRDVARGITVAVPLDCKDPQFDIQVSEARWDYYYIERYASKRQPGGGKLHVGEGMWDCRDNCYTSDRYIYNTTGFAPLVQQVGNKEWDNGLIVIVLVDQGAADVQFSYSYDI